MPSLRPPVLRQEPFPHFLRVQGLQSLNRNADHPSLLLRVGIWTFIRTEDVFRFFVESGQMELFLAHFPNGVVAGVLENAE